MQRGVKCRAGSVSLAGAHREGPVTGGPPYRRPGPGRGDPHLVALVPAGAAVRVEIGDVAERVAEEVRLTLARASVRVVKAQRRRVRKVARQTSCTDIFAPMDWSTSSREGLHLSSRLERCRRLLVRIAQ